MTRDELTGLIGEYRAGIEAQLHLLNQMADIAQRQREISRAGDLAAFERVADVRDHIMRSLVTIEEGLRAACSN